MAKGVETVLCYAAGAIFAVGWWLWIDAHVYSQFVQDDVYVTFPHYLPAIINTVALVLMNLVSWSDLNSNGLFSEGVSTKAKIVIFVAFVLSFACVGASIWIAVVHWFQNMEPEPKTTFPGVALIVQNVLISGSAFMYRFAKPQEDDGGF